jgi:leucyl aminopeptidase
VEIVVQQRDALQEPAPLVAIGAFEGEPLPAPLADLIEEGDFAATPRQKALIYPRGAATAKRVLLLGLGKREALSAEAVRQAAAVAAQQARDLKLTAFAIALPSGPNLLPEAAAQAVAEGATLGLYSFLEYKTGREPQPEPERVTLLAADEGDAARRGVAVGEAIAAGVKLARDLANHPGNVVTPAYLGDTAVRLGEELGLQTTVLGLEELRAQGFGGILAVGQGSAQEPRFIVMEYGAGLENVPTVALVGKGITFDTGGISIKPAEKMDDMKMDMGGAAAVFGAMHAVASLKLPLHVVGLISSAENMPSATAFKPGDIITTLSGKTVEVLNTDAEGRVVLADALHYAQRYSPQGVVDLATLTGAIMVALGPHAIGAMGTSPELMQRLERAGEATGERVWELPLWDEYREMVKSEIADLRNTGGARFGGAITAAAFLAAFTGDMPWVHLDIAGTAWTERSSKAYVSRGATGVGVRLLTQLLRDWANGNAIP